ncbi:MAG TPA: hypothetical protein DCE42_27415 [Myxococcales bacterium]|nr:hypothetical protein [Deltaproteobacteria bacterium]MBU50361.1 hypothetical protein [Deltaproteobacteria bacterium]HAA58522.1 hypothetical protein [Myxococcales bacterium]
MRKETLFPSNNKQAKHVHLSCQPLPPTATNIDTLKAIATNKVYNTTLRLDTRPNPTTKKH